jgi:hypothetical protein
MTSDFKHMARVSRDPEGQHLHRRALLSALAAPIVLTTFRAPANAAPPSGFVPVTNFGANGDGVMDDTDALVRAHGSGEPVYYPRTAAYYRISRVLTVSAPTISNGAEIRIVGDGLNATTIFRVSKNSRPITISGFVLDGGYKGGTKGEWSHGIDVSGGTGVTIASNTIRNPYGDCVYVGSFNNSTASHDIRIHDNKLINPRRCNVAVVCGENVTIENNICAKESDYVSGIDLEPNVNGFDYVRRVRILNNQFSTSGKFLLAGVNNGIYNTDLVVSGNRGQSREFFRAYENALLRNMTITRNTFAATSPKGLMFDFRAVEGSMSENVDRTACEHGYRSANFYDCKILAARNIFCS